MMAISDIEMSICIGDRDVTIETLRIMTYPVFFLEMLRYPISQHATYSSKNKKFGSTPHKSFLKVH